MVMRNIHIFLIQTPWSFLWVTKALQAQLALLMHGYSVLRTDVASQETIIQRAILNT